MKTNLVKSFCTLVLILIAISGCKKSSDDTPEDQYQSPSLATNQVVIEVPSKLLASNDPHAQTAAGFMAMANAFSGYSAFFSVPNNATQSTTKSSGTIYTWSYGGTTVKLTYNDDGINRTWTWYLNNVKYMDCQEALLSNSGSFNVYDVDNGGAVVLVYNWSQTGTLVNATMKIIGSTTYFLKISSSINGNSGTFDMYEGASDAGFHFINVTWLVNGSGTWWINYDGILYSGSWTA